MSSVQVRNDPRYELIGKLCHYRNPKIAAMATALSARLDQVHTDTKPAMFSEPPSRGVSWAGEGNMRTEPAAPVSHLNDVVDLDATTAQYRGKTGDPFIKSPAVGVPSVPPAGAAPPNPHFPSPRAGYPSPHTPGTGPYPPPSSYQQFPGFQPHFAGYTGYPGQHQTRNWYAAM